MDTRSRQRRRDGALESLNAAMEAINIAEERSGIAPAKTAFGSVSALLAKITGSMANEQDYIELGLSCADICQALDRGTSGKRPDELSQSLSEAINQLTATVGEIKKKAIEHSRRNTAPPLPHAKNNKEMIAAWKSELNRILLVFNTELAVNTYVIVTDIRRDVSRIREEIGDRVHSAQTRLAISNTVGSTVSPLHSITPGELPPPPLRACFGRDELIEEIIAHAANLTPIALIGAGGIGKTSIALAVLHDNRIKKRFGDNRRFIRCDQFPASRVHLLSRLSTVIGAGIENPEDLTPLRPFLSSKDMFLVLDNAESILDPHGTNVQGIYGVVKELSSFDNICLCITSRISTIPPDCETLEILALSMEAAHDTFYRIYRHGEQSVSVDDILRQLDFHPLSITLLATVAHHNKWSTDRLSMEWDAHHTQVLRTDYDGSLAATIEVSLASPTFQELGPDARDLLGVIALFPQGVDENLDWLLPTISDRKKIFDKFCVLSLTYRNNGFVTMLAPLRDYLCPKGPEFSPLLHTTKEHYFRKLSVWSTPGEPGFEEARWIMSEDVNVEHLLDVFTSADANSDGIWPACAHFMRHLSWHKRRLVVLGPKIEGLPDNHPSKPECLFELSRLFDSVGNRAEYKRLLIHALELWEERGDDLLVAQTLGFLSDVNLQLDLYKEGISRANGALEIYERHNDIWGQAESLIDLAWLLDGDDQLDAAETAGSRAIGLFTNINDRFGICQCHHILGNICRSKGETEKAINHYETALGIAFSNWDNQLFGIHRSLARLFYNQGKFGNAHVHIERAKSHAVNDPYNLGRTVELQAQIWYEECRFEEAKSGTLGAVDIYEKLGAAEDLERCRELLRDIEGEMNKPVASGE
ncbi:hypothetical protein BDM02DRAFT_3185107 [Thelephora ganbajun]|uniref:Uncharacterized protein n=1 Tax=Thelephora ganbajun TaxID=370292 RepID=A0ACB6ZMP4_THEGA|nr:hypothetical protein BDM02DRAFT_3185107 [Thelephora ganbajun]